MTYYCGIGEGMRSLGLEPRDPHYKCDAPGCEARANCLRTDGFPYAWKLLGRSPPGWRSVLNGADRGVDYCKVHRALAGAK